jgi:hypothetical protein
LSRLLSPFSWFSRTAEVRIIPRDGGSEIRVARVRLNQALIAATFTIGIGGIAAAAASGWLRALFAAAAIAATPIAVRRAFRTRIFCTEQGIWVDNYWRSYSASWGNVKEVRLWFEYMGVLPQDAITFVLVDGAMIRAQATSRRQEEQLRAMDELARYAPEHVYFVPAEDW